MIVSLVEIGVWAGWSATKYMGGGLWSLVSYGIWGHVTSEEEKFKALLMKRIGDLEHSNEELTAAVLAHGEEGSEVEGTKHPVPGKPKLGTIQTVTYYEPESDDKKPPPPAAPASLIALPEAPKEPISFPPLPVTNRVATVL